MEVIGERKYQFSMFGKGISFTKPRLDIFTPLQGEIKEVKFMHKILGVIVKCDTNDTEEIINRAECAIGDYLDAYDYYSLVKDMWPGYKNVISAQDEQFFVCLKKLIESQLSSYEFCLEDVRPFGYYKDIYEGKYKPKDWACIPALKSLTAFVSGELTSNSYIFDAEKDSTIIRDEDKERYKKEADKYSMVCFDVHI